MHWKEKKSVFFAGTYYIQKYCATQISFPWNWSKILRLLVKLTDNFQYFHHFAIISSTCPTKIRTRCGLLIIPPKKSFSVWDKIIEHLEIMHVSGMSCKNPMLDKSPWKSMVIYLIWYSKFETKHILCCSVHWNQSRGPR